jgi:quercetin 2,3-dioxygenase
VTIQSQAVAPSFPRRRESIPTQTYHSNNSNDAIKIIQSWKRLERLHWRDVLCFNPSDLEILMLTLRPSAERGYADHGWLKSFHSFSFAGYYDPAHMGFGNLRVINEDRVAPGRGFGTHGHRDMEIISYVLSGSIGHKDNIGNGAAIPPGDVQRMSAGTGIQHSEFNHATDETTHFLQIWIEPNVTGIAPGYEQKSFADHEKRGALRLVASNNGAQGSVTIHADAKLYAGLFDASEEAHLTLDPARKAYVHLVRGELDVNGTRLKAGDAAKLQAESTLHLSNGQNAEVLVFDLAG